MKKIFIFILFLFISAQAISQYKTVLFGLRAGANLAWLNPDTEGYDSDGVKPGFSWGFIGEFYLMENYAITTGFNMNFTGGKMNYPYSLHIPGTDSTILSPGVMNRDYSFKYLQIPLCLKMQTELSERVTIFGKIGLGTAFNLDAKATGHFEADDGQIHEDKKNIGDDIALMRESLLIGGGVEITIKGSTAVIIDFMYDNAFNNILSGDNPFVPDKPRAVQNFVELGAGIVF